MPTRYFLAAIAAVSVSIGACSEKKPEVNFLVKPESLGECDDPVVATLTWNVEVPGVKTVKIFAVEGVEAPILFTHSGASGTAQTGKWARAGLAFILKDEDETKQLGKVIIQSTKC